MSTNRFIIIYFIHTTADVKDRLVKEVLVNKKNTFPRQYEE